MSRRACFLTIVLILASVIIWPTFAENSLKIFKVEEDPIFAKAMEMLQRMANRTPAGSVNQFCVLGVSENNDRLAWIIWKPTDIIMLWEGQDLNEFESRRILHLKTDVVKSDKDLHGSTYLVTREWVDNLESTCAKSGLNLKLISKRPN